jgi:hypothetical protein
MTYNISFYKCTNCNEIITGALHHSIETCSCGNWVDQEQYCCRTKGNFTNITNELSIEKKCQIYTLTCYKCNYLQYKDESYTDNCPYFNEVYYKHLIENHIELY